MQFLLDEDKLTIVIEDEGEGFTRKEVADPLDPENLLKSSGRGLFLNGSLYGHRYLRSQRHYYQNG